jgi:hypothetical protein
VRKTDICIFQAKEQTPVSLARTVVLYLFALVVPERRGVPVLGLAILVSASAVVSAWHLQQTSRSPAPGHRSETLLPRDAPDRGTRKQAGWKAVRQVSRIQVYFPVFEKNT